MNKNDTELNLNSNSTKEITTCCRRIAIEYVVWKRTRNCSIIQFKRNNGVFCQSFSTFIQVCWLKKYIRESLILINPDTFCIIQNMPLLGMLEIFFFKVLCLRVSCLHYSFCCYKICCYIS